MQVETAHHQADRLLESASNFVINAGRRIEVHLRESHGRCVDGLNKADMAQSHRLALLSGLPGLVTADGVVLAEPTGQTRPKNTTWLKIPTTEGIIGATVNCVKVARESNVYRLARCEVDDLADFALSSPLLDVPAEQSPEFLMGVSWTFRPSDRSMSFFVRLLCGRLEFEHRLFRAYAARDLVRLDTRVEGARYGTSVVAAGPVPQLVSRRNELTE